jgi:hypothetical protein
MAEEKPLFLIDIDRAIEGLRSSAPKNANSSINLESLVMYCVDLANALDGAGLEQLSEFAQELANQFKAKPEKTLSLVNDFVALTNAGVYQIHPGDGPSSGASNELFELGKASFLKKLSQLKAGEPISTETIEAGQEMEQVSLFTPMTQAEKSVSASQDEAEDAEEVFEDTFPNQEFSPAFFKDLQANPSKTPEQSPTSPAPAAQHELKESLAQASQTQKSVSQVEALNQTLDRAVSELNHLFSPRKESPPVLFTPPQPKPFSLPENLTKPIDRESAFEYSSKARYLNKHFALDRSQTLNRIQKARNLVVKGDNWSGVEVDFLLGKEQDELVRSGQQSLRHIFENLTDELLIDEVYADPDIAQQLLTILSILPPCPSIFAVQQELMIFIDLDHVTLSSEHLLAVSSMMAEIGGSLEEHHNGVRLSCPSSLLRMPMAFFTRHGEHYAVSAIQYLGEEPLTKAADSKIDFLGEVIHPSRCIYVRAGNQDYIIHAHEFLGVQNMNVHQNLPKSLERPYWMGGVALDGANNAYAWIALDRFAR